MPRCCSNIFLNQFTQQPPDVIVDPPGASLCYHYEDVLLGASIFDITDLTIDYVTIDGEQTAINKTVIVASGPGDWGWDGNTFVYQTVVDDLTLIAATAGVQGMGFSIGVDPIVGTFGFRFSIVADGAVSHTLTYSVDSGSGLQQFTVDLTGQNCDVSYSCYEASYTPENPFLIEFGAIHAVSNVGLTMFETLYQGPACTEMGDMPAFIDAIIPYIQTLHGTQATATLDIVGNTATFRILNTLLVPLHMDNQADSGCTPPNSLEQVNNFTEISCP